MSAVGLLSAFSLYGFHKLSLSLTHTHTHTHTHFEAVFLKPVQLQKKCVVFHHGNSTAHIVHIVQHIVKYGGYKTNSVLTVVH